MSSQTGSGIVSLFVWSCYGNFRTANIYNFKNPLFFTVSERNSHKAGVIKRAVDATANRTNSSKHFQKFF